MKRKFRTSLLFVVLFIITATTLFSQTRAFDDSDIDVSLQNDLGGVVVVNTIITVTLTDPEFSAINDPPNEISSASASFSQFGGSNSVSMLQDPVTGLWSCSYTVIPGTLDNVTAKVFVSGNFRNGGSSTIPDDETFTVNNVTITITDLDIDTVIQNPGPTGYAIVGSSIVVSFTSMTIDAASFYIYSEDGINMLIGPIAMAGPDANNIFTGTWNVDPLTALPANSYVIKVIAYDNDISPNPGEVNDDVPVPIESTVPIAGDLLLSYLGVNGNYSANYIAANDTIYVYAEFNPNIYKVTIDWGHTFTGQPAVEYILDNGILDIQYPIPITRIPSTTNLEIKITALATEAGNVYTDGLLINLNQANNPIVLDFTLPTLTDADVDLYYDNDSATGNLRFSPVSPAVTGYSDTSPDHIDIMLDLANWGIPNEIYGLQLRFEFEGRSVYYRDYDLNSSDASYAEPILTIKWDGLDNGASLPEGTYGITLWKLWDEAGNILDFSNYYTIAEEYPPASPLLDNNNEPQVILNRMHVVIDNTPMNFSQKLNSPDQENPGAEIVFTHNHHIDHFTGDIIFPDQVYDEWENGFSSTTFSFQVSRNFTVDTNQLRWEKGTYWVIANDGTNSWYWLNNVWTQYTVFDHSTMSDKLIYPTQTHQYANTVNFSWDATQFDAGTYTITAYAQDNAGNITASNIITIQNIYNSTDSYYTANLALIDDITITSEHNGGAYSLAPYDTEGDHNFYLNRDSYYTSLDSIAIQITVNNKNYLRTTSSVLLDLTNLGLGEKWLDQDDFSDLNKAEITISNAEVQSLSSAKAGEWILGIVGGNNYLPAHAYSEYINTDLDTLINDAVPTHSDIFNLVIPPQPTYPAQGSVSVSDDSFSPGHPSRTYNSQYNPANDGIQDSTVVTISVPSSTYDLTWKLSITNPVNLREWSKTGTLASDVSLPATEYVFAGLSNDLKAMADSTGYQELDVKLYVLVTQFADNGYLVATDPAPDSTELAIDNENPKLESIPEIYTYNHDSRSITFVDDVPIPVVSAANNSFEIILQTSEPLRTTNLNELGNHTFHTSGWNVAGVFTADNTQIAGVTGSVDEISAIPGVDNQYKLKISVIGISGLEYPNSKMVLYLPWDEAGNPGRYNNPIYPVTLDLFHNDSAEISFPIHILNARPWISKIEFTNFQSTGTVVYDEAGNVTNAIQGYVNNVDNTGTLKAQISGGYNRSVVTNFVADVSSISTMADAAALPLVNPVVDLGGNVFELTWNITDITLPNLIHNNIANITVYANSMEESTKMHTTNRSIAVIVDQEVPILDNSSFDDVTNYITADGNPQPFTFNVIDALAGIYDNIPASINLAFTENVTATDLLYNAGAITGNITLLDTTAVKNFVATLSVKDKTGNELVESRYINVAPSPLPVNVVISGAVPTANPYFKPGTDITVSFEVENYQRADKIDVMLINQTTDLQVGNTQTISAPDSSLFNLSFPSVSIPHSDTLSALVVVTYSKYDTGTSLSLNTNAINTAISGNNLIADGVDPDGLPVISATDGSLDYLTAGTDQILSFDITDADSGVNWSTPEIIFNPADGITIGALDITDTGKAKWNITVDQDIAAQRVVATITANDNVDNTGTLVRYLNIIPIPEITVTDISVTDNAPDNIDPTNWFVPGHDLKVSFTVTNPQRVNQLLVSLTVNGDPLASQTFNAGDPIFQSSDMNVLFPALTATDLDGKVIRATITGNTLTYLDSNGTDVYTPLNGDGNWDEINVDTKPVIQTVTFYLDQAHTTAVDNIVKEMNNVYAAVEVKSPNDLIEPEITLPAIQGTITVTLTAGPLSEGTGADRIIKYYYTIDITQLDYSASDLYTVANFSLDTKTIYGYNADNYLHDMIIISSPVVDQYGQGTPERGYSDVGRAPNGWFAPENDLITEYHFISTLNPDEVGVIADFDRIEDNVPENWSIPSTLVIDTPDGQPIVINLSGGRTVNIYPYLATWVTTPDYSSVWNAYSDGEPIQIDYKYWSFLPEEIVDTTWVKVDKEVPTYDETRYWVATATDDNPPVYEMISSMGSVINLSLTPPAPGVWETNRYLYLKVATKDDDGDASNPYNGVGAGWVNDPTAAGWNVVPYNTSRIGDYFYTEWKLSPITPNDLGPDYILNIYLQGVEDLVGHKNYVGSDPSIVPIHSIQYVANGPIITMGFTTSADDGTAAYMIAYQKFVGDELNTKTSPYIKPGNNLGFILKLNTNRAVNIPRGVAVESVEPILVQINDPIEINDDNEVWHDLAMLSGNPYEWYLDDDLVINPAKTVSSLGWKYKVTYLITYTDNTTTQETYTSNWFNVDVNSKSLMLIDRTSPQFVQDGIVVKSAYSVTDNYVVPGEEVEITVKFTDESSYNAATTKPFVSIEHLDTFIEGVPTVYIVNDSDITFDNDLNIWVAHITGFTAKANPGITSQEIVVNLQDPVLNDVSTADKFVEVANEGPIVPIIRGAKYLTQIYDGSWEEVIVEPVGTGTINSKIEVYVDVKYPEYIDEVSIDPVPGFTIPVNYTIRPATQADKDLIGNNSIDYVAVFDSVSAIGMVDGDINFTAHTKRIPYNAEIFTHTFVFSAPVDIMDYIANIPVVQGRDIDGTWESNIISPERRMRISVQVTNLGENFPSALPADMSGWFTLTSDPAGLLSNIPAPVITDSHKATWTIPAASIADLDITQASITITYQNIYGLTQTISHNFNVDDIAPQYAGMQLYLGDDVKADDSSGSFFYDDVWDRIRVNFIDLPNVFVGLHSVDVTFIPDPVTYSYDPSQYPQAADALANMQYSPLTINTDGSGYVDITFSAPYTGTTLANGRYIITVENLKDKFDATVPTFETYFDWQYNPAMMTLYINGTTSNFEVNVSEAPVNIIANTNSNVPIQGVEFRLFYDADGDETFTAADLNYEITSHLDNTTDMEFPYETHWNMTDDLYAFVQDPNYPNRDYRGFWLRASVITQNRDLYDVVQYVKVLDNVAPVAEPDTTEIVKSIDYAITANNNLNIPVSFNIRDAVTVQVDIYSADVIVHTINQAIANPLSVNMINWDFNGFLPGNYTTTVTSWDYIGNSSVTPGPNILLENDISNAIATVNILKHEDINDEEIINSIEFASNPVDDANDYIILEGRITNPTSTSGPLNGIASVTFGVKIVDNTGTNADVNIAPVPNDVSNQPQIPTTGIITSNLIYIDPVDNVAIIRLAIPNSFFAPYMVNGTDYTFNFNMAFTPTAMYTGIDLPEQPYSWFSVDQLAPQVTLNNISTIDPVSWAPGKQGSFSVTPVNPIYDNATEIDNTLLEWSVDGTNWFATVPQLSYDALTGVYKALNWNIAGGSVNTFLGENYFGPVQIRVTVTDNKGNAATLNLSTPINVDNQAPETRFTHIIHSVNYPNLTEITDIPNAPDEISIVTSSQQGTNGASNLRLFVDASTLGTDNVMPLMMYQRTPDGNWQPVEYDHEAWNLGNSTYPELFEFEIPFDLLSAGQHRFVVVRKDAMGNLEGDKASETVAYNNKLSNAEKLAATDLIVNVTSIDDVIASIEYPEDMAFISGKKALTANTTDNNAVEYIRFEQKVNDVWQPIATVAKATTQTITFDLDIDQLLWAPGVHLIANGNVLGELVYDGNSWNGSFELNVGTTYNFRYGIDLNNNGTWDQNEPLVEDIHGFTTFTPMPWTINFNSADYAQGIHEFRAVPLDTLQVELEHYQAPSSYMIIDNIAPVINNITSVGNVTNATPGNNVDFVTDVEELLVAADDIVGVMYQYSGIPASEMNRQWNIFDQSVQMAGNYPVTWQAPNPLFDNLDNNANGLVDEAEEANSTYYIRSIAFDKAGNFAVSTEFAVNVDTSPAKMALTKIEDVLLASTNYIYTINADLTNVPLTATEIPTGFDPAVEAEFFYQYKAEVTDTWPNNWTQIGQRVNVINSEATVELDVIQEGYYQIQVIAYDALGNNEATVTTVIFNDVTGPEITFTQVGTRPVISEEYAFANNANNFNGLLQAHLSDITEVNSITFEYSTTGIDNWVNITTLGAGSIVPDGTGGGTITYNGWDYPPFRAPVLYLRAIAQDSDANNMATEIIKLYVDALAPNAEVVSLTNTMYDNKMAVDRTQDVTITLNYTELNNDGLLDIAKVKIRFYDSAGNLALHRNKNYNDVGMAETVFTFTPVQMAGMTEGLYHLTVVLEDFAGNTVTLQPADYQMMYFDVYPPDIQSVTSLAPNVNNTVAYNHPITFKVNYKDFIGIPLDALKVRFKINNIVRDSVQTYTSIDSTNITFTWTPIDFDNHFANGNMNDIVVSAELSLKDYMEHISPIENFNINVTYGIPNVARIMAITDVQNGEPTIHYVNWNNPADLNIGLINEAVGMNQDGTGTPIKLYAYVPHNAEIPASISFSYRAIGNSNWSPITTIANGDPSWDFIDPSFTGQFQSQFTANWDIVGLDSGTYEVQATSNYNPGSTTSIITVNIYNGSIIPQVAVANIEAGNIVQRGETYTLTSNFTNTDYLSAVRYRYRYVNVNGNDITPVSSWTDFGDDQNGGVPTEVWNNATTNYSYDWFVAPYYLFNNTMQIVAQAKDIWGTVTPISSVITGNAYAIANIRDTQAPDVAISYIWNGLTDPEWVSGVVDSTLTITANITSDVMLADLARVEFQFNNVLIGSVNAVNGILLNNMAQIVWNEIPQATNVTNGVLKVITYDVYGNTNEVTKTLNIDNVLPTATFTIPEEIERGTTLVLNANPIDNLSGLLNVSYVYAPVTVPASPWIPIEIVVETPWTYSWNVPEDLIFGAEYIVQATVTDNVGNILEVTDTFTVVDNQTPMQIISVAGHIPVNGIIPVRLHNNVNVVMQVNDISIPRVEYVIRAVGATDWTHLEYADVAGTNANVLLTDVLTAYAEGNYELGVRAREARITLGQVSDMVTITLDHSLAIAATETVPASNGFFNGETFTVNFTVNTDDEIDANSIALQYHILGIDGANDPWRDPELGNAEVTRTGTNTYLATFSEIEIYHHDNVLLNGMLDFRFSVSDLAEETPNTDNSTVITNVMYDTTDPEIALNGITGNGVTENNGNYTIQLATTATIDVNAFDVLYGQITQVASGMEKVEFWYNYNGVDVLIGTDTEAPYSINWNTTGLVVGNYNLGIMAYDYAGNVNGVAKTVTIVPPANWEPYALITAMSFNGDNANQDILYAEVANWNNEIIEAVTFEYFANNIWTPFATISNLVATPFAVQFNAELMNGATKIRTVVTYNSGLISTNKPELNVTYDATEGGKLVVNNPTITANVFYNNEVRITGALSAPIVTTLYNGVYANTPAVQIVNGTPTAFFDVPSYGEYEFWTSAIDYENWMMQLNSTVLNTTNIGTITHNGIALTVPNGSFAYYENVEPAIALPLGYTELSNPAQTAFIVNPQSDLNLTVTLAATPDPTVGTIVGMYYNGNQWINVTADVIGNVVTFAAPSGFIYAVGQYTGTVDFNVVFNSIEPQYINATNNELWTVENHSTIKFFVYDGFTDGGYTTPSAGEITYQMYIDNIAVPASYNNGFITAANIMDLTAGDHIASVMVTRNNVNISAEKAFKVDITAPVIVATGTQITVTDRTLSATITDPETAISDAHLYVMGWNSDITVPMANMTVSGNTYSYTLTMDDLNALGYDINYTMEMQAVWYADNNLEMNSVTEPVNYTVNIEGPAITFTGFANGWWLNPTFNTPLTFTVTVPQGRTIPNDGVWIDLYEVSAAGENQIQQMVLAPISVSGNVYSYSFNFGQLLSPMATAVKLYVEAIDNYNIVNQSQQTYGIDMAAPIVWALAPVGAPIDNDGDGLFNEDVPNGVNEDLDWVDLDQDGFWDPEEPQIVDEDPIDYYPATLAQGTDVVVAIAFEDYQGMQILMRGADSGRLNGKNSRTPIWYYTGASGIDVTNINVTLNGAAITGTITNGTFTHDAGVLPAGHYTVVAAVGDIVGNVGSLSYEFDVVGGAPTIAINPLNGNWWLNTTGSNTFTFTVNSVAQLANGGVVANIYAEPSNTLIQGPITPTAGANNQYSVILYGGVVPADQTAVRLEVIATDVWGGTSTSNQTFLIDNNAPVITIHTPVAGTEVTYNEQVSITATVTDNASTRGILKSSKDIQDRSGSGLQTVTMTVTPPTGTPVVFSNLTGAIAEIATANQYGNYTVAITAKDVVGNESVASTNFVVPAPAPEITFQPLANDSWWLNSTNNNKLSFTINTAGINLAVGGVVANVYTIPANALFQGPVIPAAVNDVYSIDVMGGVIPVDQTGIRLEVTATNILGGTSTSNQLYGIDNYAPLVTIINPTEDAQFSYNASVNIMATISEVVGTKNNGQRSVSSDPKDKTGSGIAAVNLTVLAPDGNEAVNANYPENTQVIARQLVVNQYGTYTINILATDNVNNQAMATRSFIVTPTVAPMISFTDIAWLNSIGLNNLDFTISAVVPVTVTTNVITYPSGVTLMGPLTVSPVNGIYSVILNGSLIPAGETSVRLQVFATDQFGNATEANHYYGVDRSAPVITILNPVNGAEITLVDETTKVRIEAQISDLIPPLKNGSKTSAGSGIAGSRMVIIDPLGLVISDVTEGAGITDITKELSNLMLGAYTVRVSAWDNAGNQAMTTISFTMINTPQPPAELEIVDAYAYPNPSTDGTAKFTVTLTEGAYVNIHIYDFAGREVRTLVYSGKVQGKSKAEIVFDGRNNDGVKLARGAYFARVIANDGTKIVEKVVKIAIN